MWFKTRYVKSLEARIAAFEREREQLIHENKKLGDRLLQKAGIKEVHFEKTVEQSIKEASQLEEANMNIFEDTDGGLSLHEVLSAERSDS